MSRSKLRAVAGLAAASLRYAPGRTALAVTGVALAVLSTTLLAGLGVGVLDTAERQFDAADRDLWITGDPVTIAPTAVGGFQNTVFDSHETATAVRSREDVDSASPMAFQTVYVSADASDFQPLVGVGVPGAGSSVNLVDGNGFTDGRQHYSGGSYDGEMTQEVIVDPRLAETFDVSVGDTLHVGSTVADAREHEFTVVGVSPTFSGFLGVPTVALPLAELQQLSGTTGVDSATWITVSVADGEDAGEVAAAIQREYPEYDVRTNHEQMVALMREQAVLLAAAVTLVVVAVAAGLALTASQLALVVTQQRTELAALKAIGVSSRSLAGIVACQGLAIGVLGAAVGLAVTPPAVAALNVAAEYFVGYDSLVQTPPLVLAGGATIAVIIGTVSALAAAWLLVRVSPTTHLEL